MCQNPRTAAPRGARASTSSSDRLADSDYAFGRRCASSDWHRLMMPHRGVWLISSSYCNKAGSAKWCSLSCVGWLGDWLLSKFIYNFGFSLGFIFHYFFNWCVWQPEWPWLAYVSHQLIMGLWWKKMGVSLGRPGPKRFSFTKFSFWWLPVFGNQETKQQNH